jgi:hypothetical protein
MKGELSERESPAWHELGHAYVYRHYGYEVESVEVGDNCGSTTLPKQTVNAFHLIVAKCAGKASVDKFYGWRSPNEDNWRGSEDFKTACRVALSVSQGDHRAAALLVQWGGLVADKLIDVYWSEICPEVVRLVEHGRLDFE